MNHVEGPRPGLRKAFSGLLAGVIGLPFVFTELNHHVYFRIFLYWLVGMELHIARLADTYGYRCTLHDPKIAIGYAWPSF